MISRKLLAFSLGMVFAITQAQTTNSVIETAGTAIEVLGPAYVKPGAIGSEQSRIVLYRLSSNQLPGATSVLVNGGYHASLIQDAYSELCYKPGNVEIGARQAQVGQAPKDKSDTITALRLNPAQTHYLRVRAVGGRPVFEPVAADQAERELQGRRLQMHTISRVAEECVITANSPEPGNGAAVPAGSVAGTPARYTLAADALFAFARSDRAAMTINGTVAIDQLLSRLVNQYSRLDRLDIIGHADPLGDESINVRLSRERANTVRQYIEEKGLIRVPMTAQGRGSSEPVVTQCSRIDTPQSRACNQPNRRVVIDVTGIPRRAQ